MALQLATRGQSYAQAGVSYDEGLRAFMMGIYNYMALALAVTGGVAYLTYASGLLAMMVGSPVMWVVMLAPLGFILALSFGVNRMSVSTLQMTFWGFAVVMGLSMSSIFAVFTGASIARTFFVTAGAFAALSLYGYTTKRDLSAMGKFLFMALIGLLLAMIVNLFVASSGMQMMISVGGVLIFAGLTAYDTQRLKETYSASYDSVAMAKLSIMGALSLYLDFINMFQFLLHFLGNRE